MNPQLLKGREMDIVLAIIPTVVEKLEFELPRQSLREETGEHEQAKLFLEENLTMYRKCFPSDHPDVVWALNGLKHASQALRDKGL